jgi:hypothetical protein
MAHTGGFRSGYVTDVQMSKRRLFDEETGREVPAGTTVSVTIRYHARGLVRVAKLTMTGVTDFSILEQDGVDCSTLGVIQTEFSAGKLRFWFDPQGELYVVCDEAYLDEIVMPFMMADQAVECARWTFQGRTAPGPTVQWLLHELDRAGLPCVWREAKQAVAIHPAVRWEGDLMSASDSRADEHALVHVIAYGPWDERGFSLMLQAYGTENRRISQVFEILADRITQHFTGDCLVGTTIILGHEWESWLTWEHHAQRADGERRWGS